MVQRAAGAHTHLGVLTGGQDVRHCSSERLRPGSKAGGNRRRLRHGHQPRRMLSVAAWLADDFGDPMSARCAVACRSMVAGTAPASYKAPDLISATVGLSMCCTVVFAESDLRNGKGVRPSLPACRGY